MAAVAGSKGRLQERMERKASPQLSAVAGLLDGSWSPARAGEFLVGRAQLREVGVDTNMICNLACQYCYLEDREEGPGTVPLDRLRSWLSARAAEGTKLFAFIGKEPLADSRAVSLLGALNQARKEGLTFRTGMVTNGTLVKRWLSRLVDADLSYLDISIDGLTDSANRLRDHALSQRVLAAVDEVVASPIRERFATATVLTEASRDGYVNFVREMFARGVVTCFASPVLRFAMSNRVSDYALTLEEVWQLCERLAEEIGQSPGRQVIIDLPYRYTWDLLKSGRTPHAQIREDAFEALYWRIPASDVFLKLNPFPYSYWRALRLTHDGTAVLNMDLAAHRQFDSGAPGFETIDGMTFDRLAGEGQRVLSGFIERHLATNPSAPFERDLEGQFDRHQRLRSA